MKCFATIMTFTAVLIFSIPAVSGAGENSNPAPQTVQKVNKVQNQNQNRQTLCRGDNDGDGICDLCGRTAGSGKANKAGFGPGNGKRLGPGDGTGNQGQGPKDGTGYGAQSGKRTGPRDCSGAMKGFRWQKYRSGYRGCCARGGRR